MMMFLRASEAAPSIQLAVRTLPLLLCDKAEAFPHVALRERREPKPGAPGLQRRDDLADVVADQAEARIAGVLLDDCGPQATAANQRH